MIDQYYILYSSLLSNIKTENSLINFILSSLLMLLISEFIKNKNSYYEYIENIINKLLKRDNNYVEIIIESNENTYTDRNGNKYSRTIYSEYFQAISYYIKINKIIGIKSKIEPKKTDTTQKSFFDIFIPNQCESFIICPIKNIHCIMKYIKKNINSDKEHNNILYIHQITIFSDIVDIFSIEYFLDEILQIYNNYKRDKSIDKQSYFYYDYSTDEGEILNYTIKEFSTNKIFNTIFFEEKNMYLNQLNFFLENETWYKNKGIPHHLGILLHGNPGCGKTSIIKATLEHTKRHAFVIPLNRVKTCGELENIFYSENVDDINIPINKRIYIFEDVDCVSNIVFDRKNKKHDEDDSDDEDYNILSSSKKNNDLNNNNLNKNIINLLKNNNKTSFKHSDKLNLSCLLNIIDGIIETPGRIIIMTTNYPEKLDKALLREGRIDLNIELKLFDKTMIKQLLLFFYEVSNEYFENNNNYNKIIDYKISPAQIINICQKNIANIDNTIYEIMKLTN
jgi:ATP-dependent Zn protease